MPGTRTFALFKENGLPPPKSIVECDGSTFNHLIEQLDMISIVGHWRLRYDNYDGRLQKLKLKARMPSSLTWTVSLVQKAYSPLTPVAATMVTAIKDEAKKLAFARGDK